MTNPSANKKKANALRRRKKRGGFLRILALGLLVIITFCAAFYLIFLNGPWDKMRQEGGKAQVEKAIVTKHAPLSDQPKPAPSAVTPDLPKHEPETPAGGARIAILIDDMGYRKETGARLIALDLPLSFAFLPHGPHTADLLAKARQQGRDILLHFPMQPDDAQVNAGPGVVTVAMDRDTVRKIFAENLAVVPGAIGINNHMGSRFTSNREAMLAFLKLAKEKELFFLDSRTGVSSIGEEVARGLGIKTGHRNIFLDNDHDRAKVAAQFEALVALAVKQGSAIAIGHPSEETLAVLEEFARRRDQRVTLVGVHELLN